MQTNKPKYLETLKQIAPSIAFSVSREVDQSFTWDGDGPDPIEEGFEPCDVTVSASAILNGETVDGNAYLGGSYYKPGEPCGEVSGYLPQMLEEAATELRAEAAKRGAVAIVIELENAINFLNRVMRELYEAQRAA